MRNEENRKRINANEQLHYSLVRAFAMYVFVLVCIIITIASFTSERRKKRKDQTIDFLLSFFVQRTIANNNGNKKYGMYVKCI